MMITVDKQWRITARMRVESRLPFERVVPMFDDFAAFLTTDPLHRRITVVRDDQSKNRGPAGVELVIHHELLGVHIDRVGRVLRFVPGRELAVSDLSKRGNTCGFPHVCRYLLSDHAPQGAGHSLLYEVRGKWTARWVPRPVVHLWIGWVMAATQARLLAHVARQSA